MLRLLGALFVRTLVTGEHFARGEHFECPYSWKILLDARLQIKSEYWNKHSKARTRVKDIDNQVSGYQEKQVGLSYHQA